MDRFDAMRTFVRVLERRSFTAAASDLGLPRSTVSEAVQQLEARLGARLLQRTTRTVRPTLDGEAYYQRCLSLIADLEEAEGAFRGARPSGLLRIDVQGTLARHVLTPALPAFLARYPDIRLHISEGERLVDAVREGADCVLRVGEPRDASLVGRRVALLPEITCASPAYLAAHGTPTSPDDLDGHVMVGFVSSATGAVFDLEFQVGGAVRHVSLPSRVTVTGVEMNVEMARLGFGLLQAPRYHLFADLAAGRLVEVLADVRPTPTPVSILYPHSRQLSPRVRAFVDWTAQVFARAEI